MRKRVAKKVMVAVLTATILLTQGEIQKVNCYAFTVNSSLESYEYYGEQLDTIAKKIYDSFYENYVVNPTSKSFVVDFGSTKVTSTALKETDYLQQAFDAFFKDYPQVYWVEDMNCKYSIIGTKISNFTITSTVSSGLTTSTKLEASIDSTQSKIDEIIDGMPSSAKTNYAKLKYIHDYIIKNTIYVENGTASHQITGALDGKAVCDGYSNLFKALCDELGINCITQSSSSHQWNLVQMEDENWYLVDCTWDDPIIAGKTQKTGDDSNLRYDYFLVGSKQMTSSTSHTPTTISIGGIKFTYPTLSTTAFSKDYYDTEEGQTALTSKPSTISNKTMKVDGTYKIKVKNTTSTAKIKYSSSNKKIATVSSTGKIVAKKKGTATITVKVIQAGTTYKLKIKLTVKKNA